MQAPYSPHASPMLAALHTPFLQAAPVALQPEHQLPAQCCATEPVNLLNPAACQQHGPLHEPPTRLGSSRLGRGAHSALCSLGGLHGGSKAVSSGLRGAAATSLVAVLPVPG